MHNYIHNDTKVHYIIIRMDLETKKYEYFDGYNKYGKDTDGICIVNNTIWRENLPIARLSKTLDYMVDMLNGILKYDTDDEYAYFVCECRTNLTVDANAPVGNVTVK